MMEYDLLEGLAFDHIVMHKLGNIESKLDSLHDKIEEHIDHTHTRFKPLEDSNKKLSWWIGLATGIGTILGLVIEKIGFKWLNLF